MTNLKCLILGHDEHVHLDYIYGSLPREHVECKRCDKTLKFEKPTDERHQELIDQNVWVGDGDTRGCKAL